MLQALINQRRNEWLSRDDCPVRELLAYIRQAGHLRDAQICAIETYLFLKIAGQNRPLGTLFAEGFFNENYDLAALPLSQQTRDVLQAQPAARALFEYARLKQNGQSQLPELEKLIQTTHGQFDHRQVIADIFYREAYTDYLFSLPMGAGKTYLMAAFIYLDLYFAGQEPDNPAFAHNFLVLAPSGMKSSILPSLKTIERFNPAWVVPEPAASGLRRLLKFTVLDQPRAARKTTQAKNPNAHKIASFQPFDGLMGLVMVVNPEKVILDRLDSSGLELFEKTDDEKDKYANELRNLIGKIPNLSIHIDEVHHAATDDIKLRQVVNRWNAGGTITTVVGYSGTPFLPSPETVEVLDGTKLKFGQITTTVEYYPLKRGIGNFLKRPEIRAANLAQPLEIVRRGVTAFFERYRETRYADGTCAKLAIYCGSIERLEEEIFPFLVNDLQISPDAILKYHKGNKTHKLPAQNEVEFLTLDTPLSAKRVILLVQIGKEGWDCRSLTGVILSQQGDCPTNMVLQTACRCLREVTSASDETALIYLNEANEKILDRQLRDEQKTSIAELNELGKRGTGTGLVERTSRVERLKLPPVAFYRLKVKYDTLVEDEARPAVRLTEALTNGPKPATVTVTSRTGLEADGQKSKEFIQHVGTEAAGFAAWLQRIAKGSFGSLTVAQMRPHEAVLRGLFERVTTQHHGARVFNDRYDLPATEAAVRLAFRARRHLQTQEEVLPETAELLLVEKLKPVERHDKLYPVETDAVAIREADASGKTVAELQAEKNAVVEQTRQTLVAQGLGHLASGIPDIQLSAAVYAKDRSFHVLPYSFKQSRFELDFLRESLSLRALADRRLELYFNGERELTGFRIECYRKLTAGWRSVGLYTPDFLLLDRTAEGAIHRVLIIETKGSGFQDQKEFRYRNDFIRAWFVPENNRLFGYRRFEYLFLSDEANLDDNLAALDATVQDFFTKTG